ncbi:TPA: GrpB family protein [Pseudomonas aeruginosa]|nr:GrpB family protein [Pseudomonas aeruginosa]
MNTEKKTLSWKDTNEITIFEAGDPNENPWVLGQPKIENIEVEAYDAAWATQFQTLRNSIDVALAGKALAIEHVGSTAVPGLPAKPVIDIDVIVDDPENEDAYVPALTALGYTLTVRERSWYQHRMLRHDSPRANVHVFGPNCPEHIRHILFRDWLCAHPEDRDLYAGAKILAKDGVDTAQAYNMKKQAAVRAIYERIFKFHGLPKSD